jgi:hypothetical protein
MSKRLRVKHLLFVSDFNETCIFSTDFRKNSNTKFHHYPSYESWVVPCGQMDRQTDGHTEMTKLIVAFRNFAKEPKNTRWILMTFWERNSLLHKIVSRYARTFCVWPKCGTAGTSILICLKNYSLHLSSFFQIAIACREKHFNVNIK